MFLIKGLKINVNIGIYRKIKIDIFYILLFLLSSTHLFKSEIVWWQPRNMLHRLVNKGSTAMWNCRQDIQTNCPFVIQRFYIKPLYTVFFHSSAVLISTIAI